MGRLSERTRFYGLLIILCGAGYVWLWLGMRADGFAADRFAADRSGHFRSAVETHNAMIRQDLPAVCLVKQVTTLPCPSCGSTRSVLHILSGDFPGALYWNPLGFILFAGLFAAPFWIAFDLIGRKESLKRSFHRTEFWLRKWWIALPLAVLILANWAWNLVKGF